MRYYFIAILIWLHTYAYSQITFGAKAGYSNASNTIDKADFSSMGYIIGFSAYPAYYFGGSAAINMPNSFGAQIDIQYSLKGFSGFPTDNGPIPYKIKQLAFPLLVYKDLSILRLGIGHEIGIPLNNPFRSIGKIEHSFLSELSVQLPLSFRANARYIHAYNEALKSNFLDDFEFVTNNPSSRNRTMQLGLSYEF